MRSQAATPETGLVSVQSKKVAPYEPANYEQLLQLANHLSKSGLVPDHMKGKPHDVLLVMLKGKELGLGFVQSLEALTPIRGKVTASADVQMGLCVRRRDVCEYFTLVELADDRCTYETKRVGSPKPVRYTYTMRQAERSGYAKRNPNYQLNPQSMLSARCKTGLARLVYPDLVGNLYDEYEVATFRPAEGEESDADTIAKKLSEAEEAECEPAEEDGGPGEPEALPKQTPQEEPAPAPRSARPTTRRQTNRVQEVSAEEAFNQLRKPAPAESNLPFEEG